VSEVELLAANEVPGVGLAPDWNVMVDDAVVNRGFGVGMFVVEQERVDVIGLALVLLFLFPP
jgi:hypothetical protein